MCAGGKRTDELKVIIDGVNTGLTFLIQLIILLAVYGAASGSGCR